MKPKEPMTITPILDGSVFESKDFRLKSASPDLEKAVKKITQRLEDENLGDTHAFHIFDADKANWMYFDGKLYREVLT